MPDSDDRERFEEIVAPLREDGRFTDPGRRRIRRLMFLCGIACCLVAVVLITAGGVTASVLAVIPWAVGMTLVLAGRPRP